MTFPNPFAGLVPGQGLNAATVARAPAAAAVSAVHRLLDEPAEPAAPRTTTRSKPSRPSATRNGVMFAVNYTLDEARGRAQLLHRLGRRRRTAISRAISGGTGSSSPRSSICRSVPASDRRQHHRPRRRPDRRLAVQHHRRDPVGPAARAERQRHPARSRTSRCPRASSRSAWFDNSSTALNNPRPDGTFAWSVLGTERLPRHQGALP